MRKDGSDHKHEWHPFNRPDGDLVIPMHRCSKCGLKSRKGETQHDNFAKSVK